jgi:hypothetical protein
MRRAGATTSSKYRRTLDRYVTAMFVSRKLYTTRMPRAFDEQPGVEWATVVVRKGQTGKRWLTEKANDKHVTDVWVLVGVKPRWQRRSLRGGWASAGRWG